MPIRPYRYALALVAGLVVALAAGCGSDESSSSTESITPPASTGATGATGSTTSAGESSTGATAAGTTAGETAAPGAAGSEDLLKKYGKHPIVDIQTSMGTIKVELDGEKAPISTENFLKYVESGHYKDTIFHRVIDSFMIQGGGYTANLTEKPTNPPIKNEASNGLKNKRGTIAMARTSIPDSATSQFFISVKDNASLDPENTPDGVGYAVFGKVIAGMDVVDKIRKVKTGSHGGMQDVPDAPVVIKSATIEKKSS